MPPSKTKPGKDKAVEGLLAIWDKTPAWEVGEAVIAAEAAGGMPAFEGTTKEWLAAAKRAGVAERGPLLAALTGKTLAETADRLEAIETWASDPRTIGAIERLISAPPWTSDSSKPTWNAVFELIARSRSARFVEIAARLAAAWDVRANFKPWLNNALRRAIKDLPARSPEVSPAVAKQLAALTARTAGRAVPGKAATSRDAASLLAEIYAQPHDDGPRLVYADLLQERGDPRGELIALQLSGGDPKRQKELIKQHGKAWLGPLAPVLGADYEFRRGFLARAMVKLRHKADADKYADLPEWATVEELTWSHGTPIPHGQEPFVRKVGAHMRGLIKAFGAWAPDLLAAKQPWAIEELEVGIAGPDEVKDVIESPLLPRLKRLIIDDHGDLAWFANVASLRNIETLELYPEQLSETLRLLSRYPSLQTYRARRWVTATRGADHQLSRIVLHLDAYTAHSGGNLLNALADGLAETIDLDIAKGVEVDARLRERARTKLRGDRPSYFAQIEAPSTAVPTLGTVIELAFRPDGSIVVLDRSQLVLVDPTGTQLRARYPVDQCYAAKLIRNGTQLVAVGYRALHLIDLATGRDLLKAKPKIEANDAYVMALSADERFVTIANDQVFDLDNRVEVPAPRGSGAARAVRPDFTGWVAGRKHGEPRELMRPGSTKKIPLEDSAGAKWFRYFGDAVIAETERGLLRWDGATGALIARLATQEIQKVIVSGGDRFLIVVERKRVVIVEAATLAVHAVIPERLWWAALDARGETLVSVDNTGYQLSVRPVR